MSPVGRPDEMQDGRPGRVYRGTANPLGVALEWVCPSCRAKNNGRRLEEGCEHCGVGVPDPNAKPAQEPHPRPRIEDPPGLQSHAARVEATSATVTAGKPGDPLLVGVPLVVTRLVQYRCKPGHEAALDQTLRRSLVGRATFAWGEIISAIVDEVSPRQQDILGLAQRQPGVWLGGPEPDPHPPRVADLVAKAIAVPRQYSSPPSTLQNAFGGERMTRPPDTGPAYTADQRWAATKILEILGYRGVYTLALALQNYAELAAQESMEPEKIYTREDCLALANALMNEVPEDWSPEAEEPPPPAPTLGDA